MLAFSQQITFFSLLGFLSFSAIYIPGIVAVGPGGHFLRVRNDVHRIVARANSASPLPRADAQSSSSPASSPAPDSQSTKPTSSAAPSKPPQITPSSSSAVVKPSSTKHEEQPPTSHAQESSKPANQPPPSSSPPAQEMPSSSTTSSSSSSAIVTPPPQDPGSAVYIPGTPVTNSDAPPIGDSSSSYDPTPTDLSSDPSNPSPDDSSNTNNADPNANLNAPSDTPTQNGFLANKGAVAALGSIGGIAGLAIIVFVTITVIRRRSRQRRQDRWDRKSHVWDDRADHDDGMAGFEKVEPEAVQMSSMSNSTSQRTPPANDYHLSYNSARDYFASPSTVALQPRSQDTYGQSEKHDQSYSATSEYPPNLLDAYGMRQSYAAANEHAPAPTIDYPPGMAYSPEVHDQYDAQQQQRRLQDLHQYTLEPAAPQVEHPYAYNASPLAHAINRGAY